MKAFRCIGCTVGRASDRPRRSLRLAELPQTEQLILAEARIRQYFPPPKRAKDISCAHHIQNLRQVSKDAIACSTGLSKNKYLLDLEEQALALEGSAP